MKINLTATGASFESEGDSINFVGNEEGRLNGVSAEKAFTLGRKLNDELLVAVYGKELAGTQAVKKLEAYLGLLKMGDDSIDFFAPVEENYIGDDFPAPYWMTDEALSLFRDAMKNFDARFFEEFSKALERRKDPAYADRFKILDHLRKQWEDIALGKKPLPTYKELKSLGVKNASQTIDELGLKDYVIQDKRGPKSKPLNKK